MIRCAFFAMVCFVLASCSGSSSKSGEDNTNGEVLTGILVDSAVEGVSFSTPTRSGATNSNGEFTYMNGEQVSFFIGNTVFPSAAGAPQVSPVDMAEGSSNPANTTTNIARLLQSLDSDGNPDNGIIIPSEAASVSADINFDVGTDDFENDPAVINLVANSGSVTTQLISAEAANQHLAETLDMEGSDNGPPNYRHQDVDGEAQAFISGNVITLISSTSDSNKKRNRLIVDTESRLIADLAVTEATAESDGRLQARVYMKLYNDTVNIDETTPENSVGDVYLVVSYELPPGGSELVFDACANRDIVDDDERISILDGESCVFDSTPVQIGQRLKLGVEFNRDTGALTIVKNGGNLDFQISGPRYKPVDIFNRVSIIARDGVGQITTEIYGISSDNFDDDFSNGVTVEGISE